VKPVSFVQAACASGMTCKIDVNAYPTGKITAQLGRCLPDPGTCNIDTMPCTGGLVCAAGFGTSTVGQCFAGCDKQADCPTPYQICLDGTCGFIRCDDGPDGGGTCTSGLTCTDGVCTIPAN
jgi:hypothetical protein